MNLFYLQYFGDFFAKKGISKLLEMNVDKEKAEFLVTQTIRTLSSLELESKKEARISKEKSKTVSMDFLEKDVPSILKSFTPTVSKISKIVNNTKLVTYQPATYLDDVEYSISFLLLSFVQTHFYIDRYLRYENPYLKCIQKFIEKGIFKYDDFKYEHLTTPKKSLEYLKFFDLWEEIIKKNIKLYSRKYKYDFNVTDDEITEYKKFISNHFYLSYIVPELVRMNFVNHFDKTKSKYQNSINRKFKCNNKSQKIVKTNLENNLTAFTKDMENYITDYQKVFLKALDTTEMKEAGDNE